MILSSKDNNISYFPKTRNALETQRLNDNIIGTINMQSTFKITMRL